MLLSCLVHYTEGEDDSDAVELQEKETYSNGRPSSEDDDDISDGDEVDGEQSSGVQD